MANKDVVRVVEGEASESDSEEEINTHEAARGVKVQGEASETDSDDDIPQVRQGTGLPPLRVDLHSAGDFGSSSESDITTDEFRARRREPPKYDTLFHRKLRDRNANFRSHIESAASHAYLSSAKDITSTTQQLVKSQMYAQDVSHNLRVLSSDLKSLESKVDIIINCNILPTLHVPISMLAKDTDKLVKGQTDDPTVQAMMMAS
ncbi:uncharacterized protein LOC144432840 [Glandiceps talaboti]